MKKLSFILIIFLTLKGYAQTAKSRSTLQQLFISSEFIKPQLKKSPLKITKTNQIDSLFAAIQHGWLKIAADSLAKYRDQLTIDEFNNIDAYCYYWALINITTDLNIINFNDYLVKNYMIPAMHHDYLMLQRLPTSKTIAMIRGSNLGNTLGIGSESTISKETFLQTFNLYTDFKNLFDSLSKSVDVDISNSAKKQLNNLDEYYYPMNARFSYYKNETDKAFNYIVTGLSVDKYSKSLAIDLSHKMTAEFNNSGEKDKSFALLNILAVNTTADNLNRDTLKSWYLATDAGQGYKVYSNLQQKLSSKSFKNSGRQIGLPAGWNFIANAIPIEKLKKAKYILADFWYTGCPPCVAEIPKLNNFYNKLKLRDDVIFISINTDYINGKFDKKFVMKRSAELNIRYPILYDNNITKLDKQFSVTGYPTKFILSTSGELLTKTDESDISIASFETFLKEYNK